MPERGHLAMSLISNLAIIVIIKALLFNNLILYTLHNSAGQSLYRVFVLMFSVHSISLLGVSPLHLCCIVPFCSFPFMLFFFFHVELLLILL